MSDKASPQIFGILRIMIFIDAAYLRENLKDLFSDDLLDYRTFVDILTRELSLPYFYSDIVRVYYYDATPINPDKKEKMREIYIQRIRNLTGFEERLGNLKITKKKQHKQKGVDTLIAVDMLTKAYENHYDIGILVSGDEDYMPVVDAVKNTGKRVFGVFFKALASSTLVEYFDRSLVLDSGWFKERLLKDKVKILEFSIPDTIKVGQKQQINTKIDISITKAFLKVLIATSDGQEYSSTSCEIIRNEERSQYSSSLNVVIPEIFKESISKAFLIVYNENESDDSIIAYKEKEIQVRS